MEFVDDLWLVERGLLCPLFFVLLNLIILLDALID